MTDSTDLADQTNAHFFLAWDARYFKPSDYPLLLRWYAEQGYIPKAAVKSSLDLAAVWKEAFVNTGGCNNKFAAIIGKMQMVALAARDKTQQKTVYRVAGTCSSPSKLMSTPRKSREGREKNPPS